MNYSIILFKFVICTLHTAQISSVGTKLLLILGNGNFCWELIFGIFCVSL